MSRLSVLIGRVTALRDHCNLQKRKSSWMTGAADRILSESVVPIANEVLDVLGESQADIERLRDRVRDLEAEREGWKNRARDAVRDANIDYDSLREMLEDERRCEICCYLVSDCTCESGDT